MDIEDFCLYIVAMKSENPQTAYFQEILKDFALPYRDVQSFSAMFQRKDYEDKQFLIRQEEMDDRIYFIEEGVVRSYNMNYEGQEATVRFAQEGEFIMGSMAQGAPSSTNIQCVGPCRIYSAPKERIWMFTQSHPSLQNYFNSHLARGFNRMIELLSNLIRLKAGDRYKLFLETFPGLIDRVPHYMVANFLGITPIQLSRIRKSLESAQP